jgi:hypothetical protein
MRVLILWLLALTCCTTSSVSKEPLSSMGHELRRDGPAEAPSKTGEPQAAGAPTESIKTMETSRSVEPGKGPDAENPADVGKAAEPLAGGPDETGEPQAAPAEPAKAAAGVSPAESLLSAPAPAVEAAPAAQPASAAEAAPSAPLAEEAERAMETLSEPEGVRGPDIRLTPPDEQRAIDLALKPFDVQGQAQAQTQPPQAQPQATPGAERPADDAQPLDWLADQVRKTDPSYVVAALLAAALLLAGAFMAAFAFLRGPRGVGRGTPADPGAAVVGDLRESTGVLKTNVKTARKAPGE